MYNQIKILDTVYELTFDTNSDGIELISHDDYRVCIFVDRLLEDVEILDKQIKSTIPFVTYNLLIDKSLYKILNYWFVDGGNGKTIVRFNVVYLRNFDKKRECYHTKAHHVNYQESIFIETLIDKYNHPMLINVDSYDIEQYRVNELYLKCESIKKEEEKYE